MHGNQEEQAEHRARGIRGATEKTGGIPFGDDVGSNWCRRTEVRIREEEG